MKITAEQMKDALNAGYPVIVVINGEYYDFQPEPEEKSRSFM